MSPICTNSPLGSLITALSFTVQFSIGGIIKVIFLFKSLIAVRIILESCDSVTLSGNTAGSIDNNCNNELTSLASAS